MGEVHRMIGVGTPPRFRKLRHSALALGMLGLAAASANHSAALPTIVDTWPAGEAVPVRVSQGKANFEVPSKTANDRTLVIVSSLARGPSSVPVRIAARPAAPAAAATPVPSAALMKRLVPALKPLAIPKPPIAQPPASRTFNLMVREGDPASASNYLPVHAVLRMVGERVQIYVDAHAVGMVGEDVMRDVVATFDRQIFPTAATRWGPAWDVDGDGRFTILLTGWLSNLGGGRLAVDGFVRGADLDTRLPAPFSNHCDMMYLSASLTSGPHLRTILAHEYAHAVTFSRKTHAPARPIGGIEEEGWLDEAIAHLVEDIHGFSRTNLDYRISAFLSQPERYQLVVHDYYAADLFRSHGNRGSTYLFLRWCVDQYGSSLLDALIRNDRRGVANLEEATGAKFADLYRLWSASLYLDGLGIGGESDVRARSTRPNAGDWVLAGPRPTELSPGGMDHVWSATGTTSHYVLVEGSLTGAVRIEVSAPPQAELQVTAVRLPADLPRMELAVKSVHKTEGTSQLRALVRVRDGGPVQLATLAWEPLVPHSDALGSGSHHGRVDAKTLGLSTLSLGNAAWSEPFSLTGITPSDGPIVFKLVGRDARGRRVVAWAESAGVPTAAGVDPPG
jgi:hypothetical protein